MDIELFYDYYFLLDNYSYYLCFFNYLYRAPLNSMFSFVKMKDTISLQELN